MLVRALSPVLQPPPSNSHPPPLAPSNPTPPNSLNHNHKLNRSRSFNLSHSLRLKLRLRLLAPSKGKLLLSLLPLLLPVLSNPVEVVVTNQPSNLETNLSLNQPLNLSPNLPLSQSLSLSRRKVQHLLLQAQALVLVLLLPLTPLVVRLPLISL